MPVQPVGPIPQAPESPIAPSNRFQAILANKTKMIAVPILIATGSFIASFFIGPALLVYTLPVATLPYLYPVFAKHVPSAEAPEVEYFDALDTFDCSSRSS